MTNYIKEAENFLSRYDSKYKRFSGDQILKAMKEKAEVAADPKLTKLQKLFRITAWRNFDLDIRSYEGEQRSTVGLLAVKQAIHLINGIIKFEEKEHIGKATYFRREVDGCYAELVTRIDGFRLTILKDEEVILDRIVSGVKMRHEGSWYAFYKKVDKEVDLGIWDWNYSLKGTDIFEVNYKVTTKDIEAIKDAIREEFVNVGLMTRKAGGSGWTVGNAGFGRNRRHYYDDIIAINMMYYGETVHDYKLAVETATKVLNRFGYTEKYER